MGSGQIPGTRGNQTADHPSRHRDRTSHPAVVRFELLISRDLGLPILKFCHSGRRRSGRRKIIRKAGRSCEVEGPAFRVCRIPPFAKAQKMGHSRSVAAHARPPVNFGNGTTSENYLALDLEETGREDRRTGVRVSNPEERRNRFPIRLRRSEAPQLPPGCYGRFLLGICGPTPVARIARLLPLISIVQRADNPFQKNLI